MTAVLPVSLEVQYSRTLDDSAEGAVTAVAKGPQEQGDLGAGEDVCVKRMNAHVTPFNAETRSRRAAAPFNKPAHPTMNNVFL
jgi:hypothetical protein